MGSFPPAAGYLRGIRLDVTTWTATAGPELDVACPKCFAIAGAPCRSIRHGGPVRTFGYRSHKKRLIASYVVPRVLTARGVPVRSTGSGRLQVGAVDSAAEDLDPPSYGNTRQ